MKAALRVYPWKEGEVEVKLREPQTNILAVMQLNSRRSINEIARLAKTRAHTVNYALKRFRDAEIARSFVLINPHAVGLTDYCLFFNYQGEERQARRRILDFCVRSPQIAYVAELSGQHSYTVSLFTRSVFEVEKFFSGLSALLPKAAFSMEMAIRCSWSLIPRKYLSCSAAGDLPLTRTDNGIPREIDALDAALLQQLSAEPELSNVKLARRLSVSEGTVRTRIARLEREKIILAYPLQLNIEALGLYSFRVIIVSKGFEAAFEQRLFSFACAHPRASGFVRCLGGWNFEINFEVERPSDSVQIVDQIQDRFGASIHRIYTLLEVRVHKSHLFPPAVRFGG